MEAGGEAMCGLHMSSKIDTLRCEVVAGPATDTNGGGGASMNFNWVQRGTLLAISRIGALVAMVAKVIAVETLGMENKM